MTECHLASLSHGVRRRENKEGATYVTIGEEILGGGGGWGGGVEVSSFLGWDVCRSRTAREDSDMCMCIYIYSYVHCKSTLSKFCTITKTIHMHS